MISRLINIQVTLEDGSTQQVALMWSCSGSACSDPAPGKIVGAYYTNWANYHYSSQLQNMLMPNQIPLGNMNTIYCDVAKINNVTADISFTDINHDQYYI